MSIWQNHNFVRMWLGQTVSVIGDGVYHIAIVWWIKNQTSSDTLVALIALCAAVSGVILGPIAGVVADRVDRRKLLVTMDLVSAAVVIAPALLLAANRLEPWHVGVTATLLASAATFSFPAFQASLPRILQDDQLTAANSISQSSNALAGLIGPALGGLIGPALGGLLVTGLGNVGAVGLNSLSFLAPAALTAFSSIPRLERSSTNLQQTVFRDLLEGLRYPRGDRILWGLMMVSAVQNLVFAPISVLIPGLAKDVLGIEASW